MVSPEVMCKYVHMFDIWALYRSDLKMGLMMEINNLKDSFMVVSFL